MVAFFKNAGKFTASKKFMMELRCKFCHKLLAKVDETKGGKVFIKCLKCKTDNELDFNKK